MDSFFTEKRIIIWLRVSLGLIFLWFGILKFFGYNPVFDIVYGSWPFLASGIGNLLLAIFETIIGLGLFFDIAPLLVHLALISHLIGTFSVFILAPEIVFNPYFPILTLEGEFVFKNIALLMAGFAVFKFKKLTK